jgi:DNA-binding GntR family transcriptional regulator
VELGSSYKDKSELTLVLPAMVVNEKNCPDASRVDEVYEGILLRIVRGEIPAGTPLKSTQIARELGLSRTPVVQALQRLAADGIVLLELNKRAVVRPGAEKWLVEIHEMRELLEPHAAALAAERITPDELARLEALAAAAAPRADHAWASAAQGFDFALHLTIAEASGNFVLAEAIRKCWGFKRLSYAAADDEPHEVLDKGYHEHLAILDALRLHDPLNARAAMLLHLRSAARLRPAATIV